MKFRIEQSVWDFSPMEVKFSAWVDGGEFIGVGHSMEEIERKCKSYKEAKDIKPKITYLEI